MSVAGIWGHYRISHQGRMMFQVETATYDIPPDEDGLKTQRLGSDMTKLAGQWWGTKELLKLLLARGSRLAMPAAVYTRGESPGVVEMVAEAQLATITNDYQPDANNERQLTFALPGDGRRVRDGVVFDYYISHKAGVGAPVDGPPANLGALLAGEQFTFLYTSPNHPSPTVTSAAAKLQSASDLAFTLDVTDEVTFAAVDNTASHQVAVIAGPSSRPYYRLSITTVTGGMYYPVLLAT